MRFILFFFLVRTQGGPDGAQHESGIEEPMDLPTAGSTKQKKT